jgi:hypothetical protein
MKTKGLFFLALGFLAGAPVFSYDFLQEPLTLPTPRVQAAGGFHAADTGDWTVLFTNPGAFFDVEETHLFTQLSVNLKGPVQSLAGIAAGLLSGASSPADLLADPEVLALLKGLYGGADIIGPLSLAYVGNGLGLGVFNGTSITLKQEAPLTIKLELTEKILAYMGYAFSIPLPDPEQSLSLGLSFKGALIGTTSLIKSYAELASADLGVDMVMSSPLDLSLGVGMDGGLFYRYRDLMSIGFTALDVFTPLQRTTYTGGIEGLLNGGPSHSSGTGVVPFTLNLGLDLSPHWEFLDRWITDIHFLFDMKNLLGSWVFVAAYVNPWLRLSFGAELTLLEVFTLRVGLNQGLLSAGFGVALGRVKMNVAVYGAELGAEPGSHPVYNLMAGFQF